MELLIMSYFNAKKWFIELLLLYGIIYDEKEINKINTRKSLS